MKWIIVLTLVSSVSFTVNAESRFKGKCSHKAAEAVMEMYGHFIDEGNSAAIVSSKETRSPSIYKVLIALMDGGGEPFAQVLSVTFDANTCENPIVKQSN